MFYPDYTGSYQHMSQCEIHLSIKDLVSKDESRDEMVSDGIEFYRQIDVNS